jgi:hypothetical protein
VSINEENMSETTRKPLKILSVAELRALGPDAVGELTLVAPGRITISYGRRFAHIPLRLRSNSREI